MLLFLLQLMNLVVFLRHLHLHFIELIYVSFSWWEIQMLCFRPDMNVLKPITMSFRLSRMKTWCASCITRWRRWRIWGMKLDVSFLAEMIQGPFAMWHGRMFLKSTTGFWEQHLSKWQCWGGVSKVYPYIHVYIHTVFSCQVALRNIAVETFGSLAVHMQWYIIYTWSVSWSSKINKLRLHDAIPRYTQQLWVRWPMQPVQKHKCNNLWVHEWVGFAIHASEPKQFSRSRIFESSPSVCKVLVWKYMFFLSACAKVLWYLWDHFGMLRGPVWCYVCFGDGIVWMWCARC